jgi:hypothetical protein
VSPGNGGKLDKSTVGVPIGSGSSSEGLWARTLVTSIRAISTEGLDWRAGSDAGAESDGGCRINPDSRTVVQPARAISSANAVSDARTAIRNVVLEKALRLNQVPPIEPSRCDQALPGAYRK